MRHDKARVRREDFQLPKAPKSNGWLRRAISAHGIMRLSPFLIQCGLASCLVGAIGPLWISSGKVDETDQAHAGVLASDIDSAELEQSFQEPISLLGELELGLFVECLHFLPVPGFWHQLRPGSGHIARPVQVELGRMSSSRWSRTNRLASRYSSA